jgi:hypothetical protein
MGTTRSLLAWQCFLGLAVFTSVSGILFAAESPGTQGRSIPPSVTIFDRPAPPFSTASPEPDVGTAPRALQRKLLPDPGHQFCQGFARGFVGAVGRLSRSSRRWYLRAPHVRRPHAHRSWHRAACHCLYPIT